MDITIEEVIREKYTGLSLYLNEKSRRIWAATEAVTIGWGGITIVNKATGIDHKTIRKGIFELQNQEIPEDERLRKRGGGRKNLKDKEKDLIKDLESLIEPFTHGDPESPLRRSSESTLNLSKELKKKDTASVSRQSGNCFQNSDTVYRRIKRQKKAVHILTEISNFNISTEKRKSFEDSNSRSYLLIRRKRKMSGILRIMEENTTGREKLRR
jgi:hypothetical protein